MNSGNLFNYLFQMALGRSLTPADFGGFNALNSTMVIFAAPLAIVPLVMARFTARFSLQGETRGMGQIKALLVTALKWSCVAAAVAYALGCLLIPFLKSFLHIETNLPILLMFGVMALSFILPVPWGMLQGLQRFLGYGLAGASNAFFRFLTVFVWVGFLGFGVNGALLCSISGSLAAIGVNLLFLKDVLPHKAEPLPGGLAKEVGTYSAGMLVSSVIVMALGNLDLILVRHYCSAEGAGLYATGAILGRIAFYLPSVLMSVLFTEAVTAKEAGETGHKSLWISVGMTALLGGGFALVCALFSGFVVKILFGTQYVAAGPLLAVISGAMALLSVANILFVYFQARSEFGFVWIQAAGVGLFLALTVFHHETPMTVAWLLFFCIAFILLGSFAWFFLRERRASKPAA